MLDFLGESLLDATHEPPMSPGATITRTETLTDVQNELLSRSCNQDTPSLQTAIIFLVRAIFHAGFLLLFTLSMMEDRATSSSYQFVRGISRSLITEDFNKVSSILKAYDYVQTVVCPAYVSGFVSWTGKKHNKSWTSRPESYFTQQSVALSAMRLRQHRIRSEKFLDEDWRSVFGPMMPSAENKQESKDFDDQDFLSADKTKTFHYTSQDEVCKVNGKKANLCSNPLNGQVPYTTYNGGGYITDFNASMINAALPKNTSTINKSTIISVCTDLMSWIKNDMWLSEETRVLVVEFAVMNSNFDDAMFAMPTVLFEFPVEGGVIPSFSVIPFHSTEAISWSEYVLGVYAATTCAFFAFRLIYSVIWRKRCAVCYVSIPENAALLKNVPWYSCTTCGVKFDRTTLIRCPACNKRIMMWVHTCLTEQFGWNIGMWMSLANMGLYILATIERNIVRTALTNRMEALIEWTKSGQALTTSIGVFLDFGPLQQKMSLVFALESLCIVMTFFGTYTFMKHFEAIAKFVRLFRIGSQLLVTFIVTFSVAFVGFALAFHMALGTRTIHFRTKEEAVLNTFRLLIVDLQYSDFKGEVANRWLSILLYLLYAVMCVCVALNIFIAIINMAFTQAIVPQPATDIFLSLVLLYTRIRYGPSVPSSEEYVDEEFEMSQREIEIRDEKEARKEARREKEASGQAVNRESLL